MFSIVDSLISKTGLFWSSSTDDLTTQQTSRVPEQSVLDVSEGLYQMRGREWSDPRLSSIITPIFLRMGGLFDIRNQSEFSIISFKMDKITDSQRDSVLCRIQDACIEILKHERDIYKCSIDAEELRVSMKNQGLEKCCKIGIKSFDQGAELDEQFDWNLHDSQPSSAYRSALRDRYHVIVYAEIEDKRNLPLFISIDVNFGRRMNNLGQITIAKTQETLVTILERRYCVKQMGMFNAGMGDLYEMGLKYTRLRPYIRCNATPYFL